MIVRIGVRSGFLHIAQRHPGGQPGKERFTGHVECVVAGSVCGCIRQGW
jgi:hypothetical protein